MPFATLPQRGGGSVHYDSCVIILAVCDAGSNLPASQTLRVTFLREILRITFQDTGFEDVLADLDLQ